MVDPQQSDFILTQLRNSFPAPYHYILIQQHAMNLDEFMANFFTELHSPGSMKVSATDVNSRAYLTTGWIFQSGEPIFFANTVENEIAEMFSAAKNSFRITKEAKTNALDLLTHFNLLHLADRNPFTLSRGETKLIWLICQWIKASTYLVISNLQIDLSKQHQQNVWSFLQNSHTYATSMNIQQPQFIVGVNELPEWLQFDSKWKRIENWNSADAMNASTA